jgi:hypothetical protein
LFKKAKIVIFEAQQNLFNKLKINCLKNAMNDAEMSLTKQKLALAKNKFIDWSLASTMHGYPNIIRTTKLPIKLVWLVFILALVGCCGYFIVFIFTEYFKYETTSKIEYVYDKYMEMPAVSICFSNFFQNKDSIPLVMSFLSNETGKNLSTLQDVKNTWDFSNQTQYWDFFLKIYQLKQIISSPTYTDEQKKMIGFNATQFFLICSSEGLAPCNPSQFIWYFDLNYGNCYKL